MQKIVFWLLAMFLVIGLISCKEAPMPTKIADIICTY